MSKHFLSTVHKNKTLKGNFNDYLAYSPKSQKRSFYTRFHISEGKQTLEKLIDTRIQQKIEDQSQNHKEEIRKALADARQENYLKIEDHFRSGNVLKNTHIQNFQRDQNNFNKLIDL